MDQYRLLALALNRTTERDLRTSHSRRAGQRINRRGNVDDILSR